MIDLTGRLLAGRPRAAGHDRSSASSCSMQLYAYVRTYVRTDEGNELARGMHDEQAKGTGTTWLIDPSHIYDERPECALCCLPTVARAPVLRS